VIPIHPDCDETHSFAKYANEWGTLSYVGYPAHSVTWGTRRFNGEV